jgi:AbrB family looped-hinge helix DNA binding protein
MITTVTKENRVAIPAEVRRTLGIKPGYRLEWIHNAERNEIVLRLIPDRAEVARHLLGSGRKYGPERDSVAELIAEREAEA